MIDRRNNNKFKTVNINKRTILASTIAVSLAVIIAIIVGICLKVGSEQVAQQKEAQELVGSEVDSDKKVEAPATAKEGGEEESEAMSQTEVGQSHDDGGRKTDAERSDSQSDSSVLNVEAQSVETPSMESTTESASVSETTPEPPSTPTPTADYNLNNQQWIGFVRQSYVDRADCAVVTQDICSKVVEGANIIREYRYVISDVSYSAAAREAAKKTRSTSVSNPNSIELFFNREYSDYANDPIGTYNPKYILDEGWCVQFGLSCARW